MAGMELPIPNKEEVQEFKQLYKQRFGVELIDQEALDTAIRLVHVFTLLKLGLFPERSKDDRA